MWKMNVEAGSRQHGFQPSVEQVAYLLSRIDLFESFTPFTLRLVARSCEVVDLLPGEILFEYGSPGGSLFVILDGQLEVARGERPIAVVGKNEYVGELALLDPGVRSASVRAICSTRLLEIPQSVFEQYLRREPESLAAMMRTVARRLRAMLDDAQQAYEQLHMQVHDMLNLLNVLNGATLVADSLTPSDPNQRYLTMIAQARDRLEAMMRSALRCVRGRPSGYPREPVDLCELVRDTLRNDLALHPDVRNVQVVVEKKGTMEHCMCNSADLRRVIANLVINAAQATGPDGLVTLQLWQGEGRAYIKVSDNGPGVPAALVPYIFEPRFSTKPQGTGLGLSSARLIVESLHGGRLSYLSEQRPGATFLVELPIG
ncbi:MAG: ATP-binding protein [Candidatus Binatia bacterium]|nr:ATP-binding protein [Candidatus Binatia bacterium]